MAFSGEVIRTNYNVCVCVCVCEAFDAVLRSCPGGKKNMAAFRRSVLIFRRFERLKIFLFLLEISVCSNIKAACFPAAIAAFPHVT